MLKYWQDLLKVHKYWDTKPTLNEFKKQEHGNIEGLRKVEDVRKEPIDLPREGMIWCDIDINDEKQLDEVDIVLCSFTNC